MTASIIFSTLIAVVARRSSRAPRSIAAPVRQVLIIVWKNWQVRGIDQIGACWQLELQAARSGPSRNVGSALENHPILPEEISQTKRKEEANQPNCETHVRSSGEYKGKTLCRGNFASLMRAYAFHTFPAATETPAMAFRVSTMQCAHSASS